MLQTNSINLKHIKIHQLPGELIRDQTIVRARFYFKKLNLTLKRAIDIADLVKSVLYK